MMGMMDTMDAVDAVDTMNTMTSMDTAGLMLPAVVAAGVLARVAATLTAAATSFPGLTIRIRLALALALTIVAFPTALAATDSAVAVRPPLVLVGEALVGFAMGTAIAAVASAGAWAGGILGSVAGLSWADDFDPDGDAQSAGMARLAWWISFGAFLTAGGLQAISAGLIDSVRSMPIGSLLSGGGMPDVSLADLAVRFPAAALALAITLAIPALVAVLAFHLTTAICLRTVPFAPGAGLLQALAALVLLGAVYLGADAWAGGFGSLIQAPLEQCFDLR